MNPTPHTELRDQIAAMTALAVMEKLAVGRMESLFVFVPEAADDDAEAVERLIAASVCGAIDLYTTLWRERH